MWDKLRKNGLQGFFRTGYLGGITGEAETDQKSQDPASSQGGCPIAVTAHWKGKENGSKNSGFGRGGKGLSNLVLFGGHVRWETQAREVGAGLKVAGKSGIV